MWKKISFLVSAMLSIGSYTIAQKADVYPASRIVLEIAFPNNFNSDSIIIESAPFKFVHSPLFKKRFPQTQGHLTKWVLFSNEPLVVNLVSILGKGNMLHIYEPGDSIHINLQGGTPVYSGRNADKFRMLQEMGAKAAIRDSARKIMSKDVNSISDYLEWNNYLSSSEERVQSIFANYENSVTPFVFDYMKAERIAELERQRLMKFHQLMVKSFSYNIPIDSVCAVFDSTSINKHTAWLYAYTGRTTFGLYLYDSVRKAVQRKYKFNFEHGVLSSMRRKMLYAEEAKKMFKGDMLQSFWAYFLTSQGLKEYTLKNSAPEIDTLLSEFYAQEGYDDYKEYVRDYERKIRRAVVTAGHNVPDFSVIDENGRKVHKEDFKDKVLLLGFFNSDCNGCTEMDAVLNRIRYAFRKDTNIVFLTTFIEKEQKGGVQDVSLDDRSLVRDFNISSYPEIFLIDGNGKFVYDGSSITRLHDRRLPDPRKDEGKALTHEIYNLLALMNDGPYVIHSGDSIQTFTVKGSIVERKAYASFDTVLLKGQTDSYHKNLFIKLKRDPIKEEPSRFTDPGKTLVLSDIEGNFYALRKLLQAGKVIDENYNWVFGSGHLVFAGDMFDRGQQVTECLWLIYSLEEKAKAAGGYVHFIIGNHEIMNLNDDTRYIHKKYRNNNELLNIPYSMLYGEKSELGRWLRSKNVMEQIGDCLFVHGGISKDLNNQNVSIEEINKAARIHYANSLLASKHSDALIKTVYNSETSPFWYRSYYLSDTKRTPESLIDSTLSRFKISKIITGHTIVDKKISTHYGGKVINVDTKHSEGNSEALFIENGRYYRMNSQGEKESLF